MTTYFLFFFSEFESSTQFLEKAFIPQKNPLTSRRANGPSIVFVTSVRDRNSPSCP